MPRPNNSEQLLELLLDGKQEEALSFLKSEKDINLNYASVEPPTTLLKMAASKGYKDIVKLLIEKGARVNWADINSRVLPLTLAAKNGHQEIVKLLVENGALVEFVLKGKQYGPSPLYQAAESGHQEIVKFLLEKGADINHPEFEGLSTLEAVFSMKKEMATILMQHCSQEAKNKALYRAVYRGHKELVEFLLTNGANPNYKDQYGNENSLLMLAVIKAAREEKGPFYDAYKRIFELLIKKGANNINHPNKEGDTPLHIAIKAKSVEMVKILIENKADSSIHNKHNRTAFGLAYSYELYTSTEGLKPDQKANQDWQKILHLVAPVDYAAYHGYTDTIKLHAELGKDLFIKQLSDWDALMLASYAGHQEIVNILLSNLPHGYDAVNRWGSNALILGCYAGHEDIVSRLIGSDKFDINKKNMFGVNPLIAAIFSGKTVVVDQILQNSKFKPDLSNKFELFLISLAFVYSIVIHHNFSIPSAVFERLNGKKRDLDSLPEHNVEEKGIELITFSKPLVNSSIHEDSHEKKSSFKK
jgi:uncharacterized protein